MCNKYNDWKKWSDNNLFITDRKKLVKCHVYTLIVHLIYFFIWKVKEELLKRTTTSSFDVYVHILHTSSKGTIQLATNKPSDRPIIDPKCFSNDHDVEKMLQGRFSHYL